MALFELEHPDGRLYEVEAPEDATLKQLRKLVYLQMVEEDEEDELAVIEPIEESILPESEVDEPNFLDQLEEFAKGIPAGGLGFAESAALGAIAPLGEESELAARESILDTAQSAKDIFSADPGSEELVGRKFGEALGSFGLMGLASLIPGIGMPLAGGLAVGAGAGEQSERARAANATEGERGLATMLGAVVGLGELIPLKVLGALNKGVGQNVTARIVDRIKRAAQAAGAEGAQEAAAGVAQNLIQKGIYDPQQGVFAGTGEAFGYGAGVGGLVQGILDIALPRTRGQTTPHPLELVYDPSVTIVHEDESTEVFTKSQAEAAGYNFEDIQRANEIQKNAQATEEERREALDWTWKVVQDARQQREESIPEAEVEEARTTSAARIAQEQADKAAAAAKMPVVVTDDPEQVPLNVLEQQLGELGITPWEGSRPESDKSLRNPAYQEQLDERTQPYQGPEYYVDPEGEVVTSEESKEQDVQARVSAHANAYMRAKAIFTPEEFTANFPEGTTIEQLNAAIAQREAEQEAAAIAETPSPEVLAGRTTAESDRAIAYLREGFAPEDRGDLFPADLAAAQAEQRRTVTESDDVTPPPTQTVSQKFLKGLGITAIHPIYKRLMDRKTYPKGKVPLDVLNQELKDWADNPALRSPTAKDNVYKYLNKTPQEQISLAFTETTTPTETVVAGEEEVTTEAPITEDKTALVEALKGKTVEEMNAVVDERIAQGKRTGKEQQIETRPAEVLTSFDQFTPEGGTIRVGEPITAQEKKEKKAKETKDLTPGARARAVGNMPAGIDPALEGVDPELREEATGQLTEERRLRGIAAGERETDVAEAISWPHIAERGKNKAATEALSSPERLAATEQDKLAAEGAAVSAEEQQLQQVEIDFNNSATQLQRDNAETMTKEQAQEQIAKEFSYSEVDAERAFVEARTDKEGVFKYVIPKKPKGKSYEETTRKDRAKPGTGQTVSKKTRKKLPSAEREATAISYRGAGDEVGTASPSTEKTSTIMVGNVAIGTVKKDKAVWTVTIDEKFSPVGEIVFTETNKDRVKKWINNNRVVSNVAENNQMAALGKLDPAFRSVNPAIDVPLDVSVIEQLKQGNLKGALDALAKSNAVNRVKAIAKAFSRLMTDGEIKVVVVPTNPTNPLERYLRKELDAEKSTVGMYITGAITQGQMVMSGPLIVIDGSVGLTPSTLLHEVTHAFTVKILKNLSHPTTKQLIALYEATKPFLSKTHGTLDVYEFVAEAYSNPAFRTELSMINIKGEPLSALRRFTLIIENWIRSLRGLPAIETHKVENAAMKVDDLIGDILAPTIDSRGAGFLLENSDPDGVIEVMRSIGSVQKDFTPPTKKFRETFANESVAFLTSGVKKAAQRAFLGFTGSQALADIAGAISKKASINLKLHKLGMSIHHLMQEQRGKLAEYDDAADGLMKQIDTWARENATKVPILERLITKSTREEVDPALTRAEAQKKYSDNKTKMKAWNQMSKDWNSLGENGQNAYQAMRNAYAKRYEELVAFINRRIDAMPIEEAGKAELRTTMMEKLAKRSRIDPYFPLMRFGDYKLSFDAYNADTDSTEPVFMMFTTKRDRDNFIKNVLEGDKRVLQESIELSEARDTPDYTKNAPSGTFVNEVLRIINTNVKSNKSVSDAMQNEIVKIFIEALPETSFAKAFQSRVEGGYAGHEQKHIEIMRHKIYDLSRAIVRLQYTDRLAKLRDKVRGISEDGTSDDKELIQVSKREGIEREVQDEFVKRIEFAMHPPKDGFAQKANRTAFIWTIGMNASSALVNLSQVPLFVYPMLSGKYGWGKTGKAIGNATGLLASTALSKTSRTRRIRGIVPFGKQDTVDVFAMPSVDNLFELDVGGNYIVRKDVAVDADGNVDTKRVAELEKLLPLIQLAAAQGQLNRSLFADSLGLDSSGRDKNIVDKVTSISAFMFHQVEQYNRQVTLVAAYNLELDKISGGSKNPTLKQMQEAAREALYAAQQYNGGAVLETAPRFSQHSWGRIALMYKSFGLQMYYTMLKSTKQMLSRESSPEVSNAAFKQLVAVHLSAAFFAGVQGLPLYGALTMLADGFLEDDEDDAETIVRKYIGEGYFKGPLVELLDLDVSHRVALSNLLFQANRYSNNASPEEQIGYYMGGPAWSVGKAFIRGMGKLERGDVQRGVEDMVPAWIKNIMKAIRYSHEGAVTIRKDPILDDITNGQLLGQIIGFAPPEYSRRQEESAGLKRIERTITDNRSKLTRAYYLALRMQDWEEAQAVMRDIHTFNRRIRRKFPKAQITPKTIQRSVKQHMKTSATHHNGITLSPMVRRPLQSHLANFDPILLD